MKRIKQKILTAAIAAELLVVIFAAVRHSPSAVSWAPNESQMLSESESTAALDPESSTVEADETTDAKTAAETDAENEAETEAVSDPSESESAEVTVSESMLRVRLKTSDYSSVWHQQVIISCPSTFRMVCGEREQIYTGGQTVVIDQNNPLFEGGGIRVISESEELTVNSIIHNGGSYGYPGEFDLYRTDAGIAIVNEVELEDYLTRVISCEMPARYGLDASKIQAVCSRSFAWKKLQTGTIDEFGSVMDDSNQFQVYNSIPGTAEAWQAVQDTRGMVLTAGGEVVIPYYFSTSCGYTSDNTAWSNGSKASYLAVNCVAETNISLPLQEEEVFRNYIMNWDVNAYESSYAWFRWKYTVSLDTLGSLLSGRLSNLMAESPDSFMRQAEDGSRSPLSDAAVGAVRLVQVTKRGDGGIVLEVTITGDAQTIVVTSESMVRKVLGAGDRSYENRSQTGRSNSEGDYLPSAFFCLEEVMEGETLTGYTVWGGGNGHGIGMSQNGAAAMLNTGVLWEDVLAFFYPGTVIEDLSI